MREKQRQIKLKQFAKTGVMPGKKQYKVFYGVLRDLS